MNSTDRCSEQTSGEAACDFGVERQLSAEEALAQRPRALPKELDQGWLLPLPSHSVSGGPGGQLVVVPEQPGANQASNSGPETEKGDPGTGGWCIYPKSPTVSWTNYE